MIKKQKYLYVYILRCFDNSYYVGITSDLERRFRQHTIGIDEACYTYTRRTLQIAYYEAFSNFLLAIEWEKRIKRWSRVKKEALITSNWENLRKAAECKNESSHIIFQKKFGTQHGPHEKLSG